MMNKNIILIILLSLNTLLLVGLYGLWYYDNYSKKEQLIESPILDDKVVIETNSFYVEVKGAVKKPGVYEVNNNSLINDVINLSGGLNKNAYVKNINLSKKVKDEMVIYVYTQDEYASLNKPKEIIVYKECVCEEKEITNCTDIGQSIIVSSIDNNEDQIIPSDSNIENDNNSLININTATIEQLITLNGIGEAKAQSIINYRNEKGYFTSIEDIMNVSGISQTIYDKIKDYITI